MEKVEYPYECQCKGHEGGSRTFMAAPPDWWASKGINTPRNCPACRDWVKAQVDSVRSCNSCGKPMQLPKNYKISVFKKEGPYKDPEFCSLCESGQKPPAGTKKRDRVKPKKEKEQEPETGFGDLKFGIDPEPRIITRAASYYGTVLESKRKMHSHNREMHLLFHLSGSRYDQTMGWDPVAKVGKSPTALGSGTTLDALLDSIEPHMAETDQDNVREYMVDGKDRIYRVTRINGENHAELTILEPKDGAYGVVSTFDSLPMSYIKDQPWYKLS